MVKFKPAQTIRFTYNQPKERIDENTGDRFKEVFVLNPNYGGKVHGLDLKRMTPAEQEVIRAIFDPSTGKYVHKIPLVNDILRRMNPILEVKNPHSFYHKFVKVFIRNKDVYRIYEMRFMLNVTVAKDTKVQGTTFNPKPLFHKVESKQPQPMDAKRLELIKKVAAEKGLNVSKNVGKPLPPTNKKLPPKK